MLLKNHRVCLALHGPITFGIAHIACGEGAGGSGVRPKITKMSIRHGNSYVYLKQKMYLTQYFLSINFDRNMQDGLMKA